MISESPDLLFMPSFAIDVSRVTLNDFGHSPRNVKNLITRRYGAFKLASEVGACKVDSINY